MYIELCKYHGVLRYNHKSVVYYNTVYIYDNISIYVLYTRYVQHCRIFPYNIESESIFFFLQV